MRRTRWTSAVTWFIAAAVTSWVVGDLLLRHVGWVPVLSPWGAVTALVIAGVVLVAGLAVRRLRARERTWITPTGAATTAAAAQASAIVGAVLGGVYGGGIILALVTPRSPAMTHLAWTSTGCLLACLLWCIVGFVVEQWCSISSDGDDDGSAGPSGHPKDQEPPHDQFRPSPRRRPCCTRPRR